MNCYIMEFLFIEVRNLSLNTFIPLIKYKDVLLKYMTIQKNKIEINSSEIRYTLLCMNHCCLNEIGGNSIVVQNNGLDLFKKKNNDYGESYKTCGVIGVIVRIIDKLNRLENLTTIHNYEVKDETYQDTLIDLHNYTLLGIMCIDNSE